MAQMQQTQKSLQLDIRTCLPRVEPEQVRQRVEHIVAQGLNPAIEHIEPERSDTAYWQLWKLAQCKEGDIDCVFTELEACRREHPRHHIRLMGYEDYARRQNTAFLVYRGV